ncbi:MAG: hypothetical protein GXX85_15005 [Ignavibacteria bacterium]|mgnify:CR=1 FL=1|nr:hypothetical protein [Ignavibacteria bacterium]
MRLIYLLIVVTIGFSCNTRTNEKSPVQPDPKVPHLTPDPNIALKFTNEYAVLSSKGNSMDWIEGNRLLTANFKSIYKNLLDSAIKADPEMGLGFDPVFNAQDYPDSFVIKNIDKDGFIILQGKDWQNFLVMVKLVCEEKNWLVDGAGIINIPASKQIGH